MNEREFPPSKNYHGVDMVTFFAQMLLDQIVAMKYVKLRDSSANIFRDIQLISDQQNATSERLKEEKAFFYPNGGSVFMDYKSARDRAFPENGSLTAWGDEHIPLHMSTKEGLEVCKKQVETWWGQSA